MNKLIVKICLNCHNDFRIFLSESKKGYGKFCSRKCYLEFPRKKNGKIIKCKICRKAFYTEPNSKQVYCSRECSYKSRIGQKPWNKGYKKYNGNCIKCGEYFESSYPKKYCSQKCYLSDESFLKRIKNIGKNNRKYSTKEERHQADLESGRKCYKKHIKKRRFYYKQLGHQRRNAGGSHTLIEWELLKKQYGYTCPSCGKSEPEIRLTEDHIIPISKWNKWIKKHPEINYECNDIQNIQPLCGSCNCKKHNKLK